MSGEFDDMRDLARLLGVEYDTVRRYRVSSARSRRYADNPFPKPDDRKGGSPVWRVERREEILGWWAARAGRGAGGGRPRKDRPESLIPPRGGPPAAALGSAASSEF